MTYALILNDRVNQLFDEDPTLHPDLEIVDVSHVSGIEAGWWRRPNGAFTADPPSLTLTAERREEIMRRIDEQAEAIRCAYITSGSGQAAVYLQKQTEADAVAALDPADDPNPADFPLLSASVGVEVNPQTGTEYQSVREIAGIVRAIAAQWLAVAADIERLRLGAKVVVKAATTEQQALAAAVIVWPLPQ